jgi:hypothetical protein
MLDYQGNARYPLWVLITMARAEKYETDLKLRDE